MITYSKRSEWCKSSSGAFTLAEAMLSLVILAIVLGSIIPTFSFFSRSITSLGNYAIMSSESRTALELFGRDLHSAEDIVIATADEISLLLPKELDSVTVNYKYETVTGPDGQPSGIVSRSTFDSFGTLRNKDILFEDVDDFKLVYYNRLSVDVSGSASVLAEAKSVQINAKLLKKVITTSTTDYIISARFLMRNYN